jgi:hypothetical protein
MPRHAQPSPWVSFSRLGEAPVAVPVAVVAAEVAAWV